MLHNVRDWLALIEISALESCTGRAETPGLVLGEKDPVKVVAAMATGIGCMIA